MRIVARFLFLSFLSLFPAWVVASSDEAEQASPSLSLPAVPFVAMSPCRLADTRGNGFVGAFGAPSMLPGFPRDFPVVGQCGIPADARGVSFNFTVARTMGLGYVVAYPQGTLKPATSNVNYIAGQIVANSAVVELGASGAITAEVVGQQTDLVIDINGYYAGTIVSSLNGLSGELALVAGENVTITPSGSTLTLSASPVPGPIGPQGPQGVQGSMGPQGANGTNGAQGIAGTNGTNGAQGIAGTNGTNGAQGIAGTNGTNGAQGIAGTSGSNGADGADGTSMIFRGAWAAETAYAFGDAVSFGGSSYISLVADNMGNQPDSNPAAWSLIAQAGADGAAGTNGTNGAQGIPGINGTNGTNGAQGPQGITGDTGVDGAQGPQGPPGQGVYQSNHMLNGTTGTVYLSPIASQAAAPDVPELPFHLALVTSPCTMTGISVFVTSPPNASTSEIFTLRVGTQFNEVLGTSDLADQPLGCTIAPLSQSCSFVGSVPVVAGVIFDIRLDIIGTAPGLHHAIVALTCE